MRPRPSGGQAPSVRGGGHHTAAAGGGMAAAGMAAAAAAGIGIGAVEPTGTGAGGGGGGTGGEEAAATAAAAATGPAGGGTAAAGGGCAAAAGVSVCVAEVGEAVPVSLTRSGAARGGGDGASPAVAAGGGCSQLATAAAGGSRAAESAPLPTLSACSSTPAAAAGTGGAGETAAAGAGGGSGGTSAFPSPATSCSSSVLEGETASPCSSAVSRIAQKQAQQQQQPQHEQQTQHTLSAAASSPSPPPPCSSSSSQPQQQRGKASSLERGGLGLLHLPVSKIAKTGSGKGHVASHKGSSAAAGSKAKRGGKQISSARINDSYAVSLPNALPLKQVIWAKDAMSGVWRLCSIVHARLRTSRPAPPSRSSVSRSVSPSVGGGGGAARSTCTTPQQQGADSSSNARAGGVAAAAAFTLSSSSSSSSTGSSSSSSSSSSSGTAGCDATTAAAGAAATALPGPEDYDYYVHFLGFDRRLDQWKTWEEVREDEAELPVNEPVVKEVHDSSDEEHAGMDEDYLREHEEATKVKSIHRIRMGRYSVDTWYFSPYPKQYQNVHTLHICEFCLAFFKEETELARHMRFCECRHPPGNEIYRDKDIAMFEVDGNHCRVYCENLCFLSKLFLDHKTLRHPVSLFLFYVMTEVDEKGYHITGYFSKEKYSKNNVSCILTLPQHQRKGYGKFLINFSYSLSRAERKCGTPERPLSDLGKASYMAFWTEMILATIVSCGGRVSVQELSEKTCIETADIVACLEHQGVLRSKGDCFFLLLPQQKIKVLKEASGRPSRVVKPDELHWVPYDRYLMPFEYNPQA